MRDNLYRDHLLWVLSVDGKLMTSEEVDQKTIEEKGTKMSEEEFYRSPWSRINGDLCRHVWTYKDGQPMYDKPFDRRFKDI